MGLTPGSWTAYQVDLATLLAGRTIERRLSRKGASLAGILGTSEAAAVAASQFRNASALAGPVRKMRVPESGVW